LFKRPKKNVKEKSMRRVIALASYGLDKFCRGAAVGFLSLMLLLVLFQVLARYIFQAVPVWTEEAARYCMIWGGSKIWVVAAIWLRAIAVVVFLGPVLYHSDRFLVRSLHRISDGLEVSMAWITVAVPLTVVVILVHLVARLVGSESEQPDPKS
jgi:TRAP-type C4-dicarboxylate transport system permease small subunit